MTTQTLDAKNRKIPIAKPVFDERETAAVTEVLNSGWIVQGPQVARFEQAVAEYVGSRHAVASSSCTTALHLALLAAGIGPGDEVVLPSLTYIASANAVEYCGARPHFIDIDPRTFTISIPRLSAYLESFAGRESSPVKCLLPVSLFGLCADMEAINELAAKYRLTVIEDSACGLGARRNGCHAGTEAQAAVFSFHPRKAITTGEGGMIITDDDGIADAAGKLRNHGAEASDLERSLHNGGSLLPDFKRLGFNYRLTDLQGALGVTQMAKLDDVLTARRKAAARYDYYLQEVKGIAPPFVPDGFAHAYQSYVCLYRFDYRTREKNIDWAEIETWNRQRNRIMAGLEERGISVRQGTHAVHTLDYYRRKYSIENHDLPYSYIGDRLSIALPLYPGITDEEQIRVVETLQKLMTESDVK